MPKNSTKIGNRIKKIRDRQNLSQDRFAKKLGLSGKTISAYETGRTTPPLKILERIVETYDTPLISIKSDQKENIKSKLEMLQRELLSLKDIFDDGLVV